MQTGLKRINALARPLLNIAERKPGIAIFEVCLRCNSACGYCNLPLQVAVSAPEGDGPDLWRLPSVGRYGKESSLLQYEPAAIAKVFRKLAASGLVPRGYFSSCNLICARIVAKNIRRPVSGLAALPALLRKPKEIHA